VAKARLVKVTIPAIVVRLTKFTKPILFPKLRIELVDFPCLHSSIEPETLRLGDLMRLLVRLHHRTRIFFKGQMLAQEYPQEVLIPVSASISVSHSSRGVQLLKGTSVPLLPTSDKYPRIRHRCPMLSRNVNLVAFLELRD